MSSGSGRSSTGSGNSGASSNRPPAYSPGAAPPPYSVAGGAAVRGQTGATGGGRPYQVASGNAFAGRSVGGGTRSQINTGRAFGGGALVGGLAFPFIFWPLAFSGGYGNYYGSSIYGPPNNGTRPGGQLLSWTLLPTWASSVTNGSAPPADNGFILYGDIASVTDLIPLLAQSCSVADNTYGTNVTATPDMAVEYYRGSTFSLMLDGYNNSLPNVEASPDNSSSLPAEISNAIPAPLPSGVNSTYLICLNTTITNQLGLLDSDNAQDPSDASSATSVLPMPQLQGLVALFLLVWSLL